MAASHEEVLRRVLEWRDKEAQEQRMAPGNVIAPHIARKVGYSLPTSREALEAAGVRFSGVDRLLAVVAGAVADLGLAKEPAAGDGTDPPLALPAGDFAPAKTWAHGGSGTKRAAGRVAKPKAWELSADRFMGGKRESCEAIAMTQSSGKAIQPATVVRHLLTALAAGRTVDLRRLAKDGAACTLNPCPAPTKAVWEQLDASLDQCGVEGGVDGPSLATKDLLEFVLPDLHGKEYGDLTEEEKAERSRWMNGATWWLTLKRVGFVPAWGEAAAAGGGGGGGGGGASAAAAAVPQAREATAEEEDMVPDWL